MGTVSEITTRLSGLRKTGAGKWIARCPAHDDKNPSLTVRELDDGRILVHCFGGCSALDVVESLGLSMSDLFPERLENSKPIRGPFSAHDALLALKTEAAIVALASSDSAAGRLTEASADRVALAAGRIATALEYVYGT